MNGDDIANSYENFQSNIEQTIDPQVRMHIDNLVRDVSTLRDTERLLFCILLPADPTSTLSSLSFSTDDLDLSSSNCFETSGIYGPASNASSLHLSNQLEQSQAYTWIISHLEEDPSTCLRKDEVYDDYRIYCERHHLKVLNTADFGKVMKRAFPNVKPRRLGQRGQSRYCYGGMRKRIEVQPPSLPDITGELSGIVPPAGQVSKSNSSSLLDPILGATGSILSDVANIILQYVQQVLGVSFPSLYQLAQHLISNRYVNVRSKHAFALIAHAANDPIRALSPTLHNFSNSFPEKGFSSFDNRLRQSSSSTNESLDDRKSYIKKESSSSTPSTPKSTSGLTQNVKDTLPTSHSTPTQKGTISPNLTTNESSKTTPDIFIKSEYSSPASTPITGLHLSNSPLLHAHQKCDTKSSVNDFFSTEKRSSTYEANFSGAAYSHQSMALMMAAALARTQHHSQSTDDSNMSPRSTGTPIHQSPISYSSSSVSHKSSSNSYEAGPNSFVFQQGSSMPPAPLQPMVGAKPAYMPTYQLSGSQNYRHKVPLTSTENLDSTDKRNFKRAPPPPMDAPGSYDPAPQVHLGSVSPSKRLRYSNLDETTDSFRTNDTRQSNNDIFYPGRYESLGMLSPLPTDEMLEHANEARATGYQMNAMTNKDKNLNESGLSIQSAVYAPTAFIMALDEDPSSRIVDLPQVGASPGPQMLQRDSPPHESDHWHYYTDKNLRSKDNENILNNSQEDVMNRTLIADGSRDKNARNDVNTPPSPKELKLLQPTSPTAPRDDEQLHTPGPVEEEDISSPCSSFSGPGAPTLGSMGTHSTSSGHQLSLAGPNSPISSHSTSSSPLSCKIQNGHIHTSSR